MTYRLKQEEEVFFKQQFEVNKDRTKIVIAVNLFIRLLLGLFKAL